ncbi:hypothetical protein AOLI_G00111450 [Acnodon oligacanthus]
MIQCSVAPLSCSGEQCILDQENLIQESFTLMETQTVRVQGALRLILLHRAVSTNSPRETSTSLMLELTTVLWLHVDRYCLGMELISV